ncbi:hypothetical protein BKA70DRAFT_1448408 [Coprinopsis sp. MPI-PUGE-AT-0042]|nr:hypothetical protein BKA70DRAFT_1448408 [Coprinopsis sp. MPI-PUGE-AT-0042]
MPNRIAYTECECGHFDPLSVPDLDLAVRETIEAREAEIADLHKQLASSRWDLRKTEVLLKTERDQVVTLNIEVLRAKLAADREIRALVDAKVMRLSGKLDEAERERDFLNDGVEELRERLKKSKEMNLALINFLADALRQDVYPECSWEELKAKQGC